MCIFTSVYKQCAHTTQLWNPSLAHLFAVSEHVTEIVQREYYPYDKYKSPQTETPTSNSWEGGGGGGSEVKYSKCQDLPKFQFSGGGGVDLKSNTQSAKICLNFNGGGGVLKSNTKSGKICLNFNFWGGRVFWSQILKVPRSAYISIFWGGGGTLEPNSRTGVFWRIWTKNLLSEVNCTRNLLVHHR